MDTKINAALVLVALPTIVHAGMTNTSIRISRSLPEMEAMAAWAAPAFQIHSATAAAVTPGTVLYSEHLQVRQLAATITTPLSVTGPEAITIAAGSLFSAWWVDGERRACTSDVRSAGNKDYQLCLASRGGAAMDTAIIRKMGDKLNKAMVVPLAQSITLKTLTEPRPEEGFAWPRANIFSYQQSGGVGIIRQYNRSLLAPAMDYERRVTIYSVKQSEITLRCEAGERVNLSKPVAAQTLSYSKRGEALASLPTGTATTISLCGANLSLERTADGLVSVKAAASFTPWWSLDDKGQDLRFDGEQFAYGAQIS